MAHKEPSFNCEDPASRIPGGITNLAVHVGVIAEYFGALPLQVGHEMDILYMLSSFTIILWRATINVCNKEAVPEIWP